VEERYIDHRITQRNVTVKLGPGLGKKGAVAGRAYGKGLM